MNLLEPRPMGSFTASGLGLGTARLGAFWQGKNGDERLTAVRSAVDLGVTLIDTADVYARGLSERIVGKAIGKREGVVVMTKVGLLKTPVGLARAARASGRLPGPSGLKAAAAADTCFESSYVRAAAQACLRRQKRDRLDVLLLHEPDAATLAVRPFDDAVARDLLAEADALAASGRFGEAAQLLLTRSVEEISRRRPAALTPADTARAIAVLGDVPQQPRGAFATLARIVERARWARLAIGADDWSAARAAWHDIADRRGWVGA